MSEREEARIAELEGVLRRIADEAHGSDATKAVLTQWIEDVARDALGPS